MKVEWADSVYESYSNQGEVVLVVTLHADAWDWNWYIASDEVLAQGHADDRDQAKAQAEQAYKEVMPNDG